MKADALRIDSAVARTAQTGEPGGARATESRRDDAPAAAEDPRRAAAVQAQAAALEAARKAANEALAGKGRELAFEFSDELGRFIAKLIDKETNEVIRQIPSDAMLAIARALAEGDDTGSLVRVDA